MSTLKVDGIRSNSATSDAITLASDGTCTANITNNLSNRNLIINGAMQCYQRGQLTGEGFSVDRMRTEVNGTDESPVSSQGTVASGTTPYSLGFRNTWKIQNGNQTSGAGSSDRITFQYRFEAQDIANSGWNYTSSSSYITLSFWVKSSVAQNFYGLFQTADGTAQNYPFETGALSADTWTKVTKTIPGNSNLQFDNDNGEGIKFEVNMLRGTTNTDNSVTLNQWAAYNTSARTPDQTTTWYTTNDATFEMTGVQLEVSDHATDFEFKSFGQELALCERYFEFCRGGVTATAVSGGYLGNGVNFRVSKRATPTVTRVSDYQIGNVNTPYSEHIDVNGFAAVAQHDGSGNMKFHTKYKAEAEL